MDLQICGVWGAGPILETGLDLHFHAVKRGGLDLKLLVAFLPGLEVHMLTRMRGVLIFQMETIDLKHGFLFIQIHALANSTSMIKKAH